MRIECEAACIKVYDRFANASYKPRPYPRYTHSPTCQLFMAESSIPNSGLGMYTAAPIEKDKLIYHPEIVINYFDVEENNEIDEERKVEEENDISGDRKNKHTKCKKWALGGECTENPVYMMDSCAKACHLLDFGLLDDKDDSYWLPDDYYWDPGNTDSLYEADSVSSLIPGLGALANSHTGLVNTDMLRGRNDNTGLHRSADPGVGAYSSLHNLSYKAAKFIPAGMELFAEYGDEWFSGREYKFGPLPLSTHFEKANNIMDKLWDTVQENDPFAEDLFKLTRSLITDVKLLMAMPDTLEEAKTARIDGVALLTVPNAIRSQQWLETNGICLDNIRAGQSSIREAGRGAIATRYLKRGDIIAPLPLLHMDQEKLKTFQDFDTDELPVDGPKQLIINYAYSHTDSSLMLFPYSPVVNFVNNNLDKSKVNARVRWSTSKHHSVEWEALAVEEIIRSKRAGLMLEMVATRDIEREEEIFLDYGSEWDAAWKDHVKNWKAPKDKYTPIYMLNMEEIIRTRKELIENPYPENAMTICFVQNSIDDNVHSEEVNWKNFSVRSDFMKDSRECEIIDRTEEHIDSADKAVFEYKATVSNDVDRDIIISGLPREAIEFVDNPYSSDQHLLDGFRHPIHIPDDIFPKNWKNLENAGIGDGQIYVHKSVKDSYKSEEGAFNRCRF